MHQQLPWLARGMCDQKDDVSLGIGLDPGRSKHYSNIRCVASLLVTRMLLVAPGIATRNKKLYTSNKGHHY